MICINIHIYLLLIVCLLCIFNMQEYTIYLKKNEGPQTALILSTRILHVWVVSALNMMGLIAGNRIVHICSLKIYSHCHLLCAAPTRCGHNRGMSYQTLHLAVYPTHTHTTTHALTNKKPMARRTSAYRNIL